MNLAIREWHVRRRPSDARVAVERYKWAGQLQPTIQVVIFAQLSRVMQAHQVLAGPVHVHAHVYSQVISKLLTVGIGLELGLGSWQLRKVEMIFGLDLVQ